MPSQMLWPSGCGIGLLSPHGFESRRRFFVSSNHFVKIILALGEALAR